MTSIEAWLTEPGGLAARLQQMRKGAGLTGTGMAAALAWTQSKISKIENGRQMPSLDDLTAWAHVCGADDALPELRELLAQAQGLHRDWREQLRFGHEAIQSGYDDLAQRATVIRNVELTVIPGLLQTYEYAAARIAESVRFHHADQEEIAAATAERMRRQHVLYDTSKRFDFLITEAALRLLLCSPTAMLGQLDRLIGLTAGMPHVWFGVIPFGVQLSIAPQNRFILFDDLALVETHVGETVHRGAEAASYAVAMDSLAAEAWTGDRARELIRQVAGEVRSLVE